MFFRLNARIESSIKSTYRVFALIPKRRDRYLIVFLSFLFVVVIYSFVRFYPSAEPVAHFYTFLRPPFYRPVSGENVQPKYLGTYRETAAPTR